MALATVKPLPLAVVVLVVTAGFVPTAAGQASGKAYAETHVSFDLEGNAVTDYTVNGDPVLRSVQIQSQSRTKTTGTINIGASLSALARLDGAGLSVGATTSTEARVTAENGGTITAHDNGHGILVVESGNQSDYVVANLSSGASASAESDSQVAVTTANGTEGTFLVVGEGNVTVNEDGNVAAALDEDGQLIFRAYPDGKDDDADKQEALIANGTATAEAYVMTDGEETVVDTVRYGQNTTVEATQTAKDNVTLRVERTTHAGTILFTTVSETVVNTTGDLTVTVDGEAAVKAATYSQLQSALGSDQSRYMVRSVGSASASTEAMIAVNHFSTRTVSMRSASPSQTDAETTSGSMTSEETTNSRDSSSDGGTTEQGMVDDTAQSDGDDASSNGSSGVPGFTPVTVVVALIAAALLARVR